MTPHNDSALHNDILAWLERNETVLHLHSKEGRQAFLNRAALEASLYNSISFDGATSVFCSALVRMLLQYGQQPDGRYAIDAVLEAGKESIGLEQREACAVLLYRLAQSRRKQFEPPIVSPPTPAKPVARLLVWAVLLLIGAVGGWFAKEALQRIQPPTLTPTAQPQPTAAATVTAVPTIVVTPQPTASPTPAPSAILRSTPQTISEAEARQVFGLTAAWRPQTYIDNQYEDRGEVVIDHATGLMWQKAGPPDYMKYAEAQKYVETLKRKRLAGFDDWRLPTIPELTSLLELKEQSNGLYINPIFDATQRWCWIADRLPDSGSPGSVWSVLFDYGRMHWNDLLHHDGYVRAVRSRQ